MRTARGPARPWAVADARARHNGGMPMPRFWIAMQIVIVVCVLISAVIVVVKL